MPKLPTDALDALQEIERSTLNHYELRAEAFWEGTRDHDVSQNIAALLAALPQETGLDILDLGCGPGRDLMRFKELGHRPVGLDGSATFCEMAREYSGCEVLHQSFSQLVLEAERFDGIFANASLFHVPRLALVEVLQALRNSLRPGGVLFCSNPRGDAEGWNGRRYGNYMELDVSQRFFADAGFEMIDHYYRPEGLPREQQPWLAVVYQRVEK
ncbi:MAG: class I SAM-dependent methyltransferase [Pseudomonadota bacterium]|nr:class I SAM-dependent methyltransferase [Pseudomonadota bacterium]